jgi:NADP-dependent 3-hydroxy acid dehydrogenase YdfG
MQTEGTALITGAGTGIGRGIAIAFSAQGMRVALVGRTRETLEETAQCCEGETLILESSVNDRDRLAAVVAETIEKLGPISILVNNAGMNTRERNLADMPPDQWDQVIDVNLTGAYNGFKAVLPCFREQGDGLVINISSMAGKSAGTVGGVAYSASKHGMGSLTQSINAEFREEGIRATCIYPGEVDTPILDKRPVPVSADKRAAALQPEDIAAAALMAANLPDRAIVEEITIFPRRRVSS